MELRNLVESYILNEKLSQDEVDKYVQEYFIHEFMYIHGLISDLDRHQAYQRIVKDLIKQDSRFSNVVALVDDFVKDNKDKFPPETVIDALGRYLVRLGVSTDIFDSAYDTFVKEELGDQDIRNKDKE